jgi:hypothetical protein
VEPVIDVFHGDIKRWHGGDLPLFTDASDG